MSRGARRGVSGRAYVAVTRTLFVSWLREPVGFFFSLVFAPILVVILGLILGNDPSPEFGGMGYIDATLPAFASIVLAITGVMLLPVTLLALRETGALRRLRLTPLSPRTFVAADLTVNFVVSAVGMVLALVVGRIVFGVRFPDTLGSVALAGALGLLAFLALGYALATLYPSAAAATAIGNILLIVLMMTSGAFMPISALSDGVRRAMELSPLRHFVQLVTGLWHGEPWSDHWVSVLVMVGMLAVCGTIGAVRFRWDQA